MTKLSRTELLVVAVARRLNAAVSDDVRAEVEQRLSQKAIQAAILAAKETSFTPSGAAWRRV